MVASTAEFPWNGLITTTIMTATATPILDSNGMTLMGVGFPTGFETADITAQILDDALGTSTFVPADDIGDVTLLQAAAGKYREWSVTLLGAARWYKLISSISQASPRILTLFYRPAV